MKAQFGLRLIIYFFKDFFLVLYFFVRFYYFFLFLWKEKKIIEYTVHYLVSGVHPAAAIGPNMGSSG